MNKVFVYGTLKKGGRFHSVLESSEYIGKGETGPDFELYDTKAGYPAVKLGGNTKISGEIYNVDKDTLSKLDYIEGHPDFYERKKTYVVELDTALTNGILVHTCLIYYLDSDRIQTHYTKVGSGVWEN